MARDQDAQPLGVILREVGGYVDAAMRFQVVGVAVDLVADLFLGRDRLELDHRHVAAFLERAVLVEHIGDTARHAGGEVAAGRADHHDDAAGHVFAAVITGAFDDHGGAGIAHGEAFAGNAAEIRFAGYRAVQHGVADDDGLLGHNAAVGRGLDDDAPAGKPLADVVVAFAFEFEGHAFGKECADALAGGALQGDVNGVVRQPGVAVALGDL